MVNTFEDILKIIKLLTPAERLVYAIEGMKKANYCRIQPGDVVKLSVLFTRLNMKERLTFAIECAGIAHNDWNVEDFCFVPTDRLKEDVRAAWKRTNDIDEDAPRKSQRSKSP